MNEDIGKTSERRRVHIDDLDWEDYIYYLDGEKFNGIGFELFEDGKLRAETEFDFGMEHGLSREWYQNGQLKNEDHLKLGSKHGVCKSWFEDGAPETVATYELGILISKEVFNQAGEQTQKFELRDTDGNYQILLQNREREPAREKMIAGKLS